MASGRTEWCFLGGKPIWQSLLNWTSLVLKEEYANIMANQFRDSLYLCLSLRSAVCACSCLPRCRLAGAAV